MKQLEEFSVTFGTKKSDTNLSLLIKSRGIIEEGYMNDQIKNQAFKIEGVTFKLLNNQYPSFRPYRGTYFTPTSLAWFNVSFLTFLVQNQNKN